jgi:hypothetical protein
MGFWDKLVNGVGRAVDIGSSLYDGYDQMRGMYRDAMPRATRRKFERNVRGLGYRAGHAARRGAGAVRDLGYRAGSAFKDYARDYGGRALGGIANVFRKRSPYMGDE